MGKMIIKKVLLCFAVFCLLPALVKASVPYVKLDDSFNFGVPYVFKQSTTVDLKVPCVTENNTYCSSATQCNITIVAPDLTTIVENQPMTYNPTFFNYTLNESQTSQLGEYSVMVICKGDKTGYSSFRFEITKDGLPRPSNVRIYELVAILLFISVGITFAFLATKIENEHVFLQIIFLFVAFVMFIFAANFTAKALPSYLTNNLTAVYYILISLAIISFIYFFVWFINATIKQRKLKEAEEQV